MSTFQTICNLVVLIGATSVAILNIYTLFAKPTSFISKLREKSFTSMFKKSLAQVLPEYLEKENEKVMALLQKHDEELKEIKAMNQAQNGVMDILQRSLRSILRDKIEKIYYKYEKQRAIPEDVLEDLEEFYKDYKTLNGNHHIDKLYDRMKKWTTTYKTTEDV